jgi:hypothetical protein
MHTGKKLQENGRTQDAAAGMQQQDAAGRNSSRTQYSSTEVCRVFRCAVVKIFLSSFKTYTKGGVVQSALRKVRQTECVAGMRILPSGRSEAEVARVAHSAAGR